jgi:hypothetical protein
MAIRHQFGHTGLTVSTESGDVWQDIQTSSVGSPYRFTTISADQTLGSNWLSVGVSRLDEKDSLLGGRISSVLGGGGGARTTFLDAEARHNFGAGVIATMAARRGWTEFAGGKFQTGAYSFDVTKAGILSGHDSLGFRLAQPLRVEQGGLSMMLPTAYNYLTGATTDTLSEMSLTPSGRELDAELSYGSTLLGGSAWLGGNIYYRRQPGHIASLPDDQGAAIRFSLAF